MDRTFLASVMIQVEITGPDEDILLDAVQDYIGDGDDTFRVHNCEILDFEELK
jgi:hypothetical protein